ncbi:hypothetical protein [Phaeobacter sp. C3_T13_0]|uniref:hypothetical protein n=1 Tax=Phaeobacter cretensis TaxID=3342641 RepID=UPI0039BC6D80
MQRYTSWAEIEPSATPAEKKLRDAVTAAAFCHLGGGGLPDTPDDWTAPNPARHIRADVLRFFLRGGCADCPATELGVMLDGALVTGTLSLTDCNLSGNMLLHNCRFQNGINATRCRTTKNFRLASCRVPFLEAGGLKVDGQLSCIGAEFQNKGGTALNLQNAEIGQTLFLRSAKILGAAHLNGLKTGDQLDCDGAEFQNKGGTALNLQNAKIGQALFLDSAKTLGAAHLNGLRTGGQLSCIGAEFQNKDGMALNLQNAEIDQDLFLRSAKILGAADLNGLRTGGQLSCIGAEFQNEGGMALNLQNAEIGHDFFFPSQDKVQGVINLTTASCGDLVDQPAGGPDGCTLILNGFSYRSIHRFTDARTRLDWLARGDHWKGEFFPQPYKQLAKVLHDMGHEADAREVLYVMEKKLGQERRKSLRQEIANLRSETPSLGQRIARYFLLTAEYASDWLQRVTVGYGRKPFRSIGVLAGLIITFWLFTLAAWHSGGFAPNSSIVLTSPQWAAYDTRDKTPNPANPADHWSNKTIPGRDWESFNAFAYAADVVVPIIDFGQTEAWAPSTTRGPAGVVLWWMRWVFTILGWIVTALGAAALTGIIRRE